MRWTDWLISILFGLFVQLFQWKKSTAASKKGNENHAASRSRTTRNFDQDYRAATASLRDRLDKKFPDGEYGRMRSQSVTPYDNGNSRVLAVDQMSAAIASALRRGASVQEAAEAGAAIIGI